MELIAALWSELPLEILDHVLSFLPVPNLCRYRTVCKRWNQLICDSQFGALCAKKASKRDAPFIAMRYSTCARIHEGWCILDLNARRWYVIKDDDDRQGNGERSLYSSIVKMDGGLVCQFLEPENHSLVVYNPIARARTQIELPTIPSNCLTSEFYPDVTIVIDSISQSFKIFLFQPFDTEFLDDPSTTLESLAKDPVMRVYESATNEWKSLSSPFSIRPGRLQGSSVVGQGYLYVYVYSHSAVREERPLWRFNLADEEWENVAVAIPDELHHPELIMSANRLFLVAWSTGNVLLYDNDNAPWSFQVSELKVRDMTREVIFDISEADFVGGFNLKTGIAKPSTNFPRISVISCGNSLLFISKSTGISAAFDLATRSWDRSLPPNPLGYLPDERCLWAGKQTNLLLPCTHLWKENVSRPERVKTNL